MTTKLNMLAWSYTPEQGVLMGDVRDKLQAAITAISTLNDAIDDDSDWLYEMFGQTSGSIQDSLAEVATALDARVTGFVAGQEL